MLNETSHTAKKSTVSMRRVFADIFLNSTDFLYFLLFQKINVKIWSGKEIITQLMAVAYNPKNTYTAA